mgnify:CR=1 FL=1
MSMADLHNPGRVGQIGTELFGRTIALAEGMNIFTDALTMGTIFLAAIFVALGFFVLALQLFVSLIAFKLGSLAAFPLLRVACAPLCRRPSRARRGYTTPRENGDTGAPFERKATCYFWGLRLTIVSEDAPGVPLFGSPSPPGMFRQCSQSD